MPLTRRTIWAWSKKKKKEASGSQKENRGERTQTAARQTAILLLGEASPLQDLVANFHSNKIES